MRDAPDARPAIDLSADVGGFFRDALDQARDERGIAASDATETYLVALLVDFAKPGQLNGETLARPLTLLLAEAREASGRERFERLRTLGDGVLYVSGFFGEHLEQRGVELDYVAGLGAQAYDDAAAMLRAGGGVRTGSGDVLGELAHNFASFVAWLKSVADALSARSARSDQAMLRVYERWLKTGSGALARELWARGLTPTRGGGALH